MFYFDPNYLWFAIPGLVLGLIAQALVWFAYSNYSNVSSGKNISGVDAAKIIAEGEGYDVNMSITPGYLNDFFNPLNNTVNLSQDNAQSNSVANIAVVAHEFGHVQQKYKASVLFGIRSAMVPAVNIGSSLGYILFIVGLLLSFTTLSWIGLALFALTTVFTFITVPVELDASRRGLNLIKKYNLIESNQINGARIVLFAAALTYVAALIQSLGQLLYFASILNRRSD